MGEITLLLQRARIGDKAALDKVFELLQPELRHAADRRLARGPHDGGVGTTALVNECYLKLVQRDSLSTADRAHFVAYAASAMRSIIVDAARAAGADRRGGDAQHVPLDTALLESIGNPVDEILDVHAALEELARVDARLVQVVEMRYFAGLSDEEIAASLGITDRTVRRDWVKARLLLAHSLRS
ncbi:ECF-type sigma factor [Roseateles sp.]|uniref:ECF-type sigma factor n=1 Tax=Roseateles sp. TaxID=1971397 RepID=UPI00326740C4